MLGSGAIMVMDDTTDIPCARADACAASTPTSRAASARPCREGGTWLERILTRVVDGHGTTDDLDQLDRGRRDDLPRRRSRTRPASSSVSTAVPFPYKMTTICFVGPSAYAPVHSALTLFPEEFEAKIDVDARHVPVIAVEPAERWH